MPTKQHRRINLRINFKKTNLRKLIFTTNIFLLIPFIIAINLLLANFVHAKRQEAINMTQQGLATIEKSFTGYCADIAELTKQPYYDMSSGILDLSSASFGGQLAPNSMQEPYFSYSEDKIVTNSFRKILSANNRIYAVLIYNNNGVGRSFLKANSMLTEYDPSQDEWFRKSMEYNGSVYIGGVFRFKNIALNIGTQDYVFSVSRALKDINSGETVGVISIYSSVNVFDDFMENPVAGERYIVLDATRRVVYDTHNEFIGTSVQEDGFDLPALTQALASKETYYHNGTDNFFVCHSDVPGFTVIKTVTDQALFGNTRFTTYMFLLVELLFVVLLLFTSFQTAGVISRPLRRLTANIEEIQAGDMSVRILPDGTSEVVTLSRAFNEMLNRFDYLINIVHTSELKQKESELTLLHSQITPHFIYNTLESIRMMAEINDDEQCAAMIMLLSRMLRYSINYRLKVVTVQEELTYLESYLALHNYRSPGHFALQTDVPDTLMDFQILKLLFQPIVENAIFHGVGSEEDGCIIRISGHCTDDNFVELSIADNGSGMDDMTVEHLNHVIKQPDDNPSANTSQNDSIGLRNIYGRLRLYFGSDCDMTIQSRIGAGTTVIMRLPKYKAPGAIPASEADMGENR